MTKADERPSVLIVGGALSQRSHRTTGPCAGGSPVAPRVLTLLRSGYMTAFAGVLGMMDPASHGPGNHRYV